MREHLYSSFLAGLRGRSVHGIFILGLGLIACAYLAADLSLRQPQAVALDVGLSFLRFNLVLLAVFWVQELVGKEFERRTVLVAFAYPQPRSAYLLGRYLGVVGLLILAATILGGFLFVVTAVSSHGYEQAWAVLLGLPLVFAILGVVIDAAVVAAFTLMIASLSSVSLLPLALGVLFAIAARSFGPVFQYIRHGADGDTETAERFTPVLDAIQWVLPDLSRLDWRAWPLYQQSPAMDAVIWALVMALAYLAAMLWLAVLITNRRELV